MQIAREPLASLEIDEKRYVRFTIQGITVHSAARNAVVDTLTSVISQVNPEVIISRMNRMRCCELLLLQDVRSSLLLISSSICPSDR